MASSDAGEVCACCTPVLHGVIINILSDYVAVDMCLSFVNLIC